jgi:glutathione S-transferase
VGCALYADDTFLFLERPRLASDSYSILAFQVLDQHLADKKFMCGDEYTIADMAIWPWSVAAHPTSHARVPKQIALHRPTLVFELPHTFVHI